MSQPVFKFCIHRVMDDQEVYAEIADVQREMFDTAYFAYMALPWHKRLSSAAIGDAISRAFADGFEDAIENLKDRTVRL